MVFALLTLLLVSARLRQAVNMLYQPSQFLCPASASCVCHAMTQDFAGGLLAVMSAVMYVTALLDIIWAHARCVRGYPMRGGAPQTRIVFDI